MTALPNFAGTVNPADLLTKLDVATAELDARQVAGAAALTAKADVNSGRIAALERTAAPAGIALGSIATAFRYSTALTPASVVSKGLATFGGGGLDSDGKACLVFLTATRFVVLSLDSTAAHVAGYMRATVYELDANGVPVLKATGNYGSVGQTNNATTVAYMLGAVRISDTAVRTFGVNQPNGYNQNWYQVNTVTFDPAAVSVSASTDLNTQTSWGAANTSSALPNGATHRRRGYAIGNVGALIPFRGQAVNWTNSLMPVPAALLLDRIPGGSWFQGRSLGQAMQSSAFAIDRVTDGLFAVLTDSWIAGQAAAATLSLVSIDDAATGVAQALRIGNGVAGNVRLTAVSATLLIGGYTTGSQYSTYAWARNPATNALASIGAFSGVGALGIVPVEIVPITPTRFAVLTKGADRALTVTTYSVDTAAASGASPFAVVSTLMVNIGTAVAGAAAGDAITVAAVEATTVADKLVVVIAARNTTRAINFVETLEIA